MASKDGEDEVLLEAVFAHFAARLISQNEYFRKPSPSAGFGHSPDSRVRRRKYSAFGALSLLSNACASFSRQRDNVLVWQGVTDFAGPVFGNGDAVART